MAGGGRGGREECGVCGVGVKPANLQNHLFKAHGVGKPEGLVACGICGAAIREANRARHVEKAHQQGNSPPVDEGKLFLNGLVEFQAELLRKGKTALPCKACANNGRCVECGGSTSRRKETLDEGAVLESCCCRKCGFEHSHAVVPSPVCCLGFVCKSCRNEYSVFVPGIRMLASVPGMKGALVPERFILSVEIRCPECHGHAYEFSQGGMLALYGMMARELAAEKYGLKRSREGLPEIEAVSSIKTWDGAFFSNSPDANAHLRQLALDKPRDAASLVRYANGLRRANDYDEAVECYKNALELDPECADALYSLGAIYAHRKDVGLAKGYLEKAVPLLRTRGALNPRETQVLIDDARDCLEAMRLAGFI
ncbi:MAG: tetratricopeptide repeat protein [Candidatus Micrarchaeota archaeon]